MEKTQEKIDLMIKYTLLKEQIRVIKDRYEIMILSEQDLDTASIELEWSKKLKELRILLKQMQGTVEQ